ncbi:Ankyrin repeat-containing protein BDA1 [Camellia lanceoleosa]|nr:Ankyrin repeat-containing protein BDA1 [Camellia lanceoleosa]
MSYLNISTCSKTLERHQLSESTGYFEPLRNLDVSEASGNNSLHVAAQLGCHDAASIEALSKQPGLAEELNLDGLTPLHLACQEGHSEIVDNLIKSNRNLCNLKAKNNGLIPLHVAAMKGKVEIVKLLVDACPESVKEATALGETSLHLAVLYNKVKVFQYLVRWLGERIDYGGDLINRKDRGGKTVLHLATSRKQLQALKVLLDNQSLNKIVEVNAKNSGGFTPLDILDVLPYSGKIDMEIDKVLRRAGAMRARDMTDQSINIKVDHECRRKTQNPSNISTIKSLIKLRREAFNGILLITATLLTTITYHAGFSIRATVANSKEGYTYSYNPNGTLQLKKQGSSLTRLFILFNSSGFISSVALVIFLLHEFPMKPWPQISVSALFGAYMCSIMAVSPNEAFALLLLATPFLLLAAGGKLLGLGRQRPDAGCEDGDA